MYRQMYQHRVLLSADTLNRAIAQRARDLGANLAFADSHMALVLQAKDALALPLSTVFAMREPWWRYHLLRWSEGSDATLADLSQRLINRRLFKTVRVLDHENKEELRTRAAKAASELGFDPRYYLHEISTFDTNAADYRQSMPVVMDDGRSRHLTDADPLFGAMSNVAKRTWLAMPAEAKQQLQRQR
jgi:HD superfamily phosphohydrolase